MNKSHRNLINLTFLRRYDDYISRIIDQTPHANIYLYDSWAWQKQDIEGTLYLVERRAEPYYQLVVKNSIAMEDYVLTLSDLDDMTVDKSMKFITYNAEQNGRYIGIRIYQEMDLDRLTIRIRLMQKLACWYDGEALTFPAIWLKGPGRLEDRARQWIRLLEDILPSVTGSVKFIPLTANNKIRLIYVLLERAI